MALVFPTWYTFLYSSREYDGETGLYYLRARYYDPEIGRFYEEDPIPSVNLFTYADGNPILFVDPLGLLFGLPAGESQAADAAQYWADEFARSGSWSAYALGAFATLWTPCVSNKTVGILIMGRAAESLYFAIPDAASFARYVRNNPFWYEVGAKTHSS